jgi:hypothetical protein
MGYAGRHRKAVEIHRCLISKIGIKPTVVSGKEPNINLIVMSLFQKEEDLIITVYIFFQYNFSSDLCCMKVLMLPNTNHQITADFSFPLR